MGVGGSNAMVCEPNRSIQFISEQNLSNIDNEHGCSENESLYSNRNEEDEFLDSINNNNNKSRDKSFFNFNEINNINQNQNKINILFHDNSGNENLLLFSEDEKVSNMIKEYKKILKNKYKEINFLFKGKKLDPESNKSLFETGFDIKNKNYIIVLCRDKIIDDKDEDNSGIILSFNYHIIKNKFLELIPQISIYFDEIDKNKAMELIQSGKLEKIKSELAEVFGDDFEIIMNDIIFGSLCLKFCVFLKKYTNKLEYTNKLIKPIIQDIQKIKIIKDCLSIIAKKSFQYIENIKPLNVLFINQNGVENQNINEEKIKEFLDENISSETKKNENEKKTNENENSNEENPKKIFEKIKESENENLNEENFEQFLKLKNPKNPKMKN